MEKETITLSDREQQVLQMAATGASNQQIARDLVISINTVKVHMRNIFEKLEVQSRTEASMLAIQAGLIAVTEGGAESPPTAKTFLLEALSPEKLEGWQHIYLTVASLLALAILLTPIFYQPAPSFYIPLITQETNTAAPQQIAGTNIENNASNTQWTTRNPMTVERAGLAVVAQAGKLYAIGGRKANNKTTRFVEIYDPARNEWSDGTTKPTATTDIAGAIIADKIYIPGGCTDENEALNILEIYDPANDTWAQGAALPAARCGYGLAQVADELYLFGGWDGTAFSDSIFVYEARRDQWRTLATPLPEPNGYMGVVTLADDIYLLGGYNGQDVGLNTYQFSPASEQWAEKAPLPEGRAGIGAVAVRDHIYVIGGGWLEPVTAGEIYDPQSDTWRSFETPALSQWRNLGAVAVDTQIYAIGGWQGSSPTLMADTFSHNVLYQLFIPVSIGN